MTFLTLMTLALTVIVLVPSGAHLFELPGKIGLPRDAYFTVQGIYAGWAWFGGQGASPARTGRRPAWLRTSRQPAG